MTRIKCRKVERTAEKPRPQDRSTVSSILPCSVWWCPWHVRAIEHQKWSLSPGAAPGGPCPRLPHLALCFVFAFGKQQSAVTSGRIRLWATREETGARLSWARVSRDGVHLGCPWQRRPGRGACAVRVQPSGSKGTEGHTAPAWVLGTWAHKALFLKKGLSDTALGSESVSWLHPSPVHLLGLVSFLPVKWTVTHSCELRAVPPGLASSSQVSKGAACKSLKTRRLGPRQDSPHSGRQSRNVAASSGPAPGPRAQPGEVRSARVCPEPLHMCPLPVCPQCCHP